MVRLLGRLIPGGGTGSELRSGNPSCKCLIYLPYFFSTMVCFLMNFLLVEVQSRWRSCSHRLLMTEGAQRSWQLPTLSKRKQERIRSPPPWNNRRLQN